MSNRQRRARMTKQPHFETQCVHIGGLHDAATGGINSPIYTSTAADYLDRDRVPYPRYFNTANQEAVVRKVCALEGAGGWPPVQLRHGREQHDVVGVAADRGPRRPAGRTLRRHTRVRRGAVPTAGHRLRFRRLGTGRH